MDIDPIGFIRYIISNIIDMFMLATFIYIIEYDGYIYVQNI